MIAGICDKFVCRPVFNGDSKTVDILAIANRDKMLEMRMDKNLLSVSRTRNSSDIVTCLYVQGQYDDAGYVGIEGVNPTGLDCLFNFDYYKEIGAFTESHEDALNNYLAQMGALKSGTVAEAAELQNKITRLAEKWGTGGYVLYTASSGKYMDPIYGSGASEKDALTNGDQIAKVTANGAYSYAAYSGAAGNERWGVKFLKPVAGVLGGKEVALEAKRATLKALTDKLNEAATANEKASYTEQINTTNAEINQLITESAAVMKECITLALEIGTAETSIAQKQQAMKDADQTLSEALGEMLQEGYYSDETYVPGQEAALYSDAVEMLKVMSRPQVSYALSEIDLKDVEGYEDEVFDLNTAAHIICEDVQIGDYGFVSEVTDVKDEPGQRKVKIETDEMNIGSKTFSSFLNRITDAAQMLKDERTIYKRAEAFSPNGMLYTGKLDGIIDVLKNQLTSVSSNWYTDERGNLIFESLDGESAMMLCGSGFMVADGKTEDGWNWRTFGTGKGFTADMITAGVLRAGLITILGSEQFFWNSDNIYVIDPENENRQIRIGRYDGTHMGIAYTQDNGKTWQTAIGFDGVHLSAGGSGGTSSEYNELSGRIDDLGNQISNTQASLDLVPDKIRLAVEDVQIGGRNLLRNTATLKKANYSFDTSGASTLGSYAEDGDGGFHIACNNANVRFWLGTFPVTPGQSYVMSAQYKINSGSAPIQFQYSYRNATNTETLIHASSADTQTTRAEDGWTILSDVLTVPENKQIVYVQIAIRTGRDYQLYTVDYNIRRPKLEAGNKATDWSPAPEDVAGEIESVKTAVLDITPEYIVQEVRKSQKYQEDLASLTLTADQIVSTVRGHKAYQDDLGDKADTEYVTENFSTVEQTKDRIKAAVDSVQIGGTNLVRCGEETITIVRGVIDREWSKSAYCRSGVGIIFQPFTSAYNGAHFYTDMTVEPGQYMLSFWCWTYGIDVQPTLRCNLWGKGNGIDHYFKDIQPPIDKPTRYEIPIEVTYTATVNLRLLTWTKFTAGDIYVTDVQLEKGTKATDWSPAPEDTDAAISKVSAQLVVEAGKITANATAIQTANNAAADAKSAADTAQSLANTAQAAADAAQNTANDAKGIADGAVTRLSTAEESIDALNGAISNKVTITEVNDAIGKIALGGTNLVRCAEGTIWTRYGDIYHNWEKSKSCQSGVCTVMRAWSGTHNEVDYESNIDLEPGIYTVSFWSWYTSLNVNVTIRPNILGSGYDEYFDQYAFMPNPGVPKQYSFQLDVKYTGRAKFRFVTMTPWSVGEVYFTDVKLEKGNMATEWSPCPHDVDGAISGVAGRVTSAETTISAHSESIKNMVTTTEFGALQQVVSSQATSIENSSNEILMLASRTVGGTNLIRNTGTLKTANHAIDESGASARGKCTEDEFGGFHVVCKNENIRCWMGVYAIMPGQSYAMSVRYKINSGTAPIQFQYIFKSASGTDLYFWNSVDHSTTTTVTEDGWTVLRSVVKAPDNSAVAKVSIAIRTGLDGKLYTCDYNIRRPKFEAGSMPTDWSPSPYDPSNGLDTGENSSVKVRITSDTFDVDVPGTDGDFTLNKTGARIPVLNADMVSAKNLAYRYNGSSTLYVNPNATSAQLAAGNYYRSFVDACAAVSGRYLDYNVSILVQGTTYGDALLSGIVGTGAVYIHGNGHSLIGQLKMLHCSASIFTSNIAVSLPASSAATSAMEISACQYVTLESSVKLTGKGTNTALFVSGGSAVWMHDCELYNATQLLYAFYGAHVTALNMKGGNCTNYAWANGAILKMAGSRPDGTLRVANAALTVPADPNTLTVNYGTAQPSVPVIQTATYNYTTSDSYRGGWSYFSDDDIRQGYDGGTIYGVIWFDAATIKSALSGKTISQASLRLHMAKNVGRGVAVGVQLYGTNMAYSGRSGQPALTTSYGTIGTTEPDVTNEITIPTAVISDIVSGKIQALVLKSDDTTTYKDRFYSQNYAKFYGSTSATTANCPRLTVVYQ